MIGSDSAYMKGSPHSIGCRYCHLLLYHPNSCAKRICHTKKTGNISKLTILDLGTPISASWAIVQQHPTHLHIPRHLEAAPDGAKDNRIRRPHRRRRRPTRPCSRRSGSIDDPASQDHQRQGEPTRWSRRRCVSMREAKSTLPP